VAQVSVPCDLFHIFDIISLDTACAYYTASVTVKLCSILDSRQN